MSKLIKGTHHVGLKCKGTEQFKKTLSFYREILGQKSNFKKRSAH